MSELDQTVQNTVTMILDKHVAQHTLLFDDAAQLIAVILESDSVSCAFIDATLPAFQKVCPHVYPPMKLSERACCTRCGNEYC
jgi:hypothetical protein